MIGIHLAHDRPEAVAAAAEFVSLAVAAGLPVAACDPNGAVALELPEFDGPLSSVVAVGGDGTVLQGASYAHDHGAPVVGINVGRVGFLAEVEPDMLDALVELLVAEEPPVAPRMSIAAQVAGTASIGLNDVVVQKTEGQYMIGVDVLVDGERFLTYRADGVVLSTPTGSSAYNLSAGGPLVDPRLAAFVITPVAPYSLFRSSVALEPSVTIRCTVIHERPASVAVDGRELAVLAPGESFEISRGPDVPFIDVTGRSYPQTLKRKLRLHEGLDGVLGEHRP